MGTFAVPIEVGDPQGRQYQRLEALVDTGATYLVVPRDILVTLNVPRVDRYPFTLANGQDGEFDVGVVSLRLEGRTLPILCVFGNEGSEPLLGAFALEAFLLAPDPVNQRLVPVRGRLMRLQESTHI